MSKLQNKWLLIPPLLLGALVLGACTGEIPPELLEAAAQVEGSSAVEVEFDLSELGEELEFIGEVGSIASSEWIVADLSFVVDSATEIKGDPLVGDLVKVHASLTSDGSLLAREIEPADGDDAFAEDDDEAQPFNLENEFEFVGNVQTIAPSEWTVADQNFMILPSTEIKGSIIEGDLVKVHAFLNENAEMAASEIEPVLAEDLDDDDMDDDTDLKLVGFVEEMGDEVWVVDGFAFRVTADTQLQDEISLGDLIEVYFFASEDDMPIAREIELEDDSEEDLDDLDDDLDDDDLDDEFDDDDGHDDDDDEHEEERDHDDD